MTLLKTIFPLFPELMEQLKAENVALKAKIKGLEYENQMYKKLLDNLFLNGNQGSSQMPR